ncbi:hypothetical protein CDAR_190281 [Caerostris darwini]|uniref:Uncharacterized protein n=1 Tax=Caerostris darwini TaxID=1538125 RepID=A0AAV4MMT0_9ARAC|nr:hypothetical protein CDAR_190281 [Caerostris darwini]
MHDLHHTASNIAQTFISAFDPRRNLFQEAQDENSAPLFQEGQENTTPQPPLYPSLPFQDQNPRRFLSYIATEELFPHNFTTLTWRHFQV